jgi:hypothetical protein
MIVSDDNDADWLECPMCGDVGAYSDCNGYFLDGQPSVCGCPVYVSVDSESDPYLAEIERDWNS